MERPGPGDPADSSILRAAARYSPRPLTDGERWTADALARLRRRRYRPGAWAAFIRESLERSAESRRSRPVMVAQARAWQLVGVCAWIAAWRLAQGRTELRLRLVPGLIWWGSVCQMLEWHLGMAEGGDGRARERLSAADAITLSRFWLVPLTWGTARSKAGLPTVIFIAGATDWLDGMLARRRGRTRLGRDLDTTADFAFLTSAAFAARSAGRIGSPAFAALSCRHGLGLALALGATFARARRPAMRARPWGAVLRIGGLVLCAAGWERSGAVLVVVGSGIPPRPTAPALSPL